MYRTGIVVAIDEAAAKVRVQFDALDGVVSYWLPVLVQKTLSDKCYHMPDPGEHVVCLVDENGEEGVVLGAIYSAADAPPVSSADKFHVTFKDGTVVEYDRSVHKLTADVKGDVSVKATGRCDFDCGSQIFIKSATNVLIQAPVIGMKGGSPAVGTFEGSFRLIGNLDVEGNISATGTIIDGGGNTPHHSH